MIASMATSGEPRGPGGGVPPGADARLAGDTLRRMLATADAWLEQHAAAIDAINVFPVPDGDTGRNMAGTVRAASEGAVATPPGAGLGEVAAAAADGALLGARGNSGVILSQWLRGLALALAGLDEAGAAELAQALVRASECAYAAIDAPREGTILSAAQAAAATGTGGAEGSAAAVLAAAVARAEEAVARTPAQLPLLAEAGVVDAGAQGLAVVLAGLRQGLVGEAPAVATRDFGRIDAAWLAGTGAGGDHDGFGTCTEFVLSGAGLDLAALRRELDALGDSLVVAGDERLARVHLHTTTPEAAFAAGGRFGAVGQARTDDMDARHAELLRGGGRSGVSVVAVASGSGFRRLFQELGAAIVEGGATQNPSAAEILATARRCRGRDVLVLPNDRNVIPAARQAGNLAEDVRLHVVPATSQPAAVAALVAWDRAAGAEEARARLTEAAATVLNGAVTRAARAVERPVRLREGQPFALLEDEIVAGSETPADVLSLLVEAMLSRWGADGRPPAELLTVYAGIDAPDAEAAIGRLRKGLTLPLEIELVIGGQPHYPFLLALE